MPKKKWFEDEMWNFWILWKFTFPVSNQPTAVRQILERASTGPDCSNHPTDWILLGGKAVRICLAKQTTGHQRKNAVGNIKLELPPLFGGTFLNSLSYIWYTCVAPLFQNVYIVIIIYNFWWVCSFAQYCHHTGLIHAFKNWHWVTPMALDE